jgi:starch synthase
LISRLFEQKGLDLIAHVTEELLQTEDVQIAVVGTGDWRYEEMFYYFADKYSGKLAARITFDDRLAHCMYAGGDALLMPSKFEPCGISQMIAMKYGTVPIVRETGGLSDTVVPWNSETGEGNGFGFKNYNAHELLSSIKQAINIYKEDKDSWNKIRSNAFKSDFSWQASAAKYAELYGEICAKHGNTRPSA